MEIISVIIIILIIVAVFGLSAVVYVTSSRMLARLQDYARVKKTDISLGGTLFLLIIGVFLLNFNDTAMIGIGILAVLAGYYFIKFKGVQYPDHISTGNWDMEFVYSLGTAPIYENHDGMRCLVNHKRTLSKYGGGYDFDITPLYNINDPLPGWIRWLY